MASPPTRVLRSAEQLALGALRRIPPGPAALLARRPLRDVVRLVLVPALAARFDPRRATGLDVTFELRLRHATGPGYDPLEIRVRQDRCRVRPTSAERPDTVLTMRPDHLLRLVTGQADARAMLGDGRLVVEGDVLLFMRFPGLFGGVG